MYIAFAASIPWRVYPLLHCSLRFISCSMVCCNWTISSCPQMSVHWWLFLTFHYNSLLSIFVLRIHKNIRNFNVLKMSLILFRPNHESKIFKLIQFNIKCLLPHTNLMGYFSTWQSDSVLVLKSIFGGINLLLAQIIHCLGSFGDLSWVLKPEQIPCLFASFTVVRIS